MRCSAPYKYTAIFLSTDVNNPSDRDKSLLGIVSHVVPSEEVSQIKCSTTFYPFIARRSSIKVSTTKKTFQRPFPAGLAKMFESPSSDPGLVRSGTLKGALNFHAIRSSIPWPTGVWRSVRVFAPSARPLADWGLIEGT